MFVQPRQYQTEFQGYSVEFSPFHEHYIAIATSQYFGIVGNGKQSIVELLPSGEMKLIRSFYTKEGIYDCAWNELNENQLICGCANGTIKLFDITTRDEYPIQNYMEHTQEISTVHWSPTSKDVFASASWDGSIKIWRPDAVPAIDTLIGHQGCVYNASWHPRNEGMLASCSADLTIKLWDLKTPHRQTSSIQAHSHEILTLDWNKYNQFEVVSGSVDRNIKVWDIRNPTSALRILQGHNYAVRRLKCSPFSDGAIGSVSYDMSACFWDAKSHSPLISRCNHHSEFVLGIDFSLFVEDFVATCSWDRQVMLWNIRGMLPAPSPLLQR